MRRILNKISHFKQEIVARCKRGVTVFKSRAIEFIKSLISQTIQTWHRARINSIIRMRQIAPILFWVGRLLVVAAAGTAVILIFYSLNKFSDSIDASLKARAFTKTNEETTLFSTFFLALGAAVIGVISVSFALSLFSIQQAADRHTPKILEEFRNDRLSRAIYWILAGISLILFAFALCPFSRFLKYELALTALMVPGVFVLLRRQYLHIIDLVNPRSLIRIEQGRALDGLDEIDRHANSLIGGGFIQRAPPQEGDEQ